MGTLHLSQVRTIFLFSFHLLCSLCFTWLWSCSGLILLNSSFYSFLFYSWSIDILPFTMLCQFTSLSLFNCCSLFHLTQLMPPPLSRSGSLVSDIVTCTCQSSQHLISYLFNMQLISQFANTFKSCPNVSFIQHPLEC